jgi:hypothetical protein
MASTNNSIALVNTDTPPRASYDDQVQWGVQHKDKINWLTTTPDRHIYVADTSNFITQYTLPS